VYELAMYVTTKKKRKAAVEIEVISLSTQLGMKLTRFIQLCMLATVFTFLHMFAGGIAFYTPFDPEETTLEKWKAKQATNVYSPMPVPGTAAWAAGSVGGAVTFLFIVVACIFQATLASEREEICGRLENFKWENVTKLIQKYEEGRMEDVNEVEKRIIKSYKPDPPNPSSTDEEARAKAIANFNKEVQTEVHDEFKKSLVKREWQTAKMLLTFWFTSGFIIGGMALYAVDLTRPVVSPEDIPTQRLENHTLWFVLYSLSMPLIFCISCGGIISLLTAGACSKKGSKVAPEPASTETLVETLNK